LRQAANARFFKTLPGIFKKNIFCRFKASRCFIVGNWFGRVYFCQNSFTMKRQTLFALALFSGFIFLHCDKENPPAEAAPFITFRCPDDVTVHTTGSVGYVKYTAPDNLYTNCHSGGLSVSLVSGIPSDDYFPVGTTVVVQKVSDACGNSATCSFNVTVVKDPVDGGGNGGTLDCSNAYNSDVEFVPYQLIGQQLIFHDETGLVKDTLTVESFKHPGFLLPDGAQVRPEN